MTHKATGNWLFANNVNIFLAIEDKFEVKLHVNYDLPALLFQPTKKIALRNWKK